MIFAIMPSIVAIISIAAGILIFLGNLGNLPRMYLRDKLLLVFFTVGLIIFGIMVWKWNHYIQPSSDSPHGLIHVINTWGGELSATQFPSIEEFKKFNKKYAFLNPTEDNVWIRINWQLLYEKEAQRIMRTSTHQYFTIRAPIEKDLSLSFKIFEMGMGGQSWITTGTIKHKVSLQQGEDVYFISEYYSGSFDVIRVNYEQFQYFLQFCEKFRSTKVPQ